MERHRLGPQHEYGPLMDARKDVHSRVLITTFIKILMGPRYLKVKYSSRVPRMRNGYAPSESGSQGTLNPGISHPVSNELT